MSKSRCNHGGRGKRDAKQRAWVEETEETEEEEEEEE